MTRDKLAQRLDKLGTGKGARAAIDDEAQAVCREAAAELRRPAAAEVTDEAIDAFSVAMEEQRAKYGWPQYPRGPFAEWGDAEKSAARIAFLAFLTRLSPSPTEEEWRPIEEAPKDGTEIDVWAVPTDRRGPGFRFTDIKWSDEHQDWCELIPELGELNGLSGNFSITHFRPLPAPPSLPTDKT